MLKHSVGCSPFKLNLLASSLKGPHVLDLGAGFLQYSRWIKEQFKDVLVTAVDMIDQKSPQNISYLKANLEKPLTLESGKFSTIVAFDVIEHIQDESGMISEIMRLLSSEGVLLGSVPHDDDGFLPEYNLTFYHRSDLTHKRYYTVQGLTNLLKDAGFINVVVTPEGGVPPHVFAEFLPEMFRWPMKKIIGILVRLGLLNDARLKSDLFFVAHRK